jgi:hypothetical protein
MPEVSRRRFLQGASLLGLASLLPAELLHWARAQAAGAGYLFFDDHQAAVVREATARMIPGPLDDPLELGHPGAREANVVRYIDTLLGALTVTPERIHAGGPWSNRSGGAADYMAKFVPLSAAQRRGWERKLASLQKQYADGVKALDAAASGDFVAADNNTKDQVLTAAGAFRDLLFTHAIEGTYSIPEYGGNQNLVGWTEIKFKGDSQPRGYTPAEVTNSDGVDVYAPTGIVADLIAQLGVAAQALVRQRTYGR